MKYSLCAKLVFIIDLKGDIFNVESVLQLGIIALNNYDTSIIIKYLEKHS